MSELTNTDQTIREAMKRVMREEGLTQAALAQRLGVKQPSVADIITGRRGRQPESLLNLLDALDLELTVQKKSAQSQAVPPAPYLALAGLFDDPDSPGDVSGRLDDYLGESLEREHEESVRGER